VRLAGDGDPDTYDVMIIGSGGDGATLGRRVDRRKLSPEVEVDGEINGEAVQAVMPASASVTAAAGVARAGLNE
jgi:hypothetical protein